MDCLFVRQACVMVSKVPIVIQSITIEDRIWVKDLLEQTWGEARVVVHGDVFQADLLPGFLAKSGYETIGLITYFIKDNQCEVISLNSILEGRGVGTALLRVVGQVAVANACKRLWLVTTNDNLDALGFYQRRGFVLCGLRPGAVDKTRVIKPSIPQVAQNGIPIRDEIELEIDPTRLVE
jgi:GNAT superfamily N-acetyltransferase